MAIRSNAGTGVIVSLVVFVLATVFLLVLSIVFYASGRAQEEEIGKLTQSFAVFASKDERESLNENLVPKAKSSNESVFGYLKSQLDERNQILTGNKNAELEEITSVFRETTSANSNLASTIVRLKTGLNSRQQEVDSYLTELAGARATIQSLEDQLTAFSKSKIEEIDLVKDEWQDVQDESVKLNSEVNDLFTSRTEQAANTRGRLKDAIGDLEKELQTARTKIAQQAGELKQLRKDRNIGELYKTDPSLLVDGEVIDVVNNDLVYINRGAIDKIRLGMTFEVYESATQLREDEEDSEDGKDRGMVPGKASIEIVKVAEITSTAKVKRSTANQPILKGNVIVNAIYDPNYVFSFLVHGVFDADGDGNPETTNTFIKNRIKSWGGIVVEDNGLLPGDLDFLVLGIAPKEPMSKPRRGASDSMLENYATRQRAYRDYARLLEKARAADVPVLSANRLNILTGQQTK